MGIVVEYLKKIGSFFVELFGKFVALLEDLLPINEQIATYVAYGAIALVVLIIVLVIVLIASGSKKRKAKKTLAKANATETQQVEEVAPVEEVKEESTFAEEQVQEEVVPVEEVKEEQPAEEKQPEVVEQVEEPVQKEVAPVEEVKPVKEVAKPTVKKTVKKPTDKPVEEVKPVEEEVVETKTSRIAIGKYEVFPVNDVFLYRLKASNGEIMVTSEIYKSAKGAVSAIETVKKNVETGTLQVYEDKHGLWQFKLFAANKRLLVVSANYTSEASCTNAANSFKKFATISPVVILEEDAEHLMEEISLEALADKKGGKLTINSIDGDFDFKLLASNGVVLCSSSEYKTKSAITNAIASVKDAVKNGKFFVVKDKRGTFQFKLYSTAGRCVLVGEAYKTKNQAISAANSVASFINLATIIDKTVEEVK